MEPEQNVGLSRELKEHFLKLPRALQNAITSSDVEKNLRTLSEKHKLHLDQWGKLENEVMLALLGLQPVEKLIDNIQNEVGVSHEIAEALALDIADVVFQPVRKELEEELSGKKESADAASSKNEVVIPVAAVEANQSTSPATPPPPSPTQKVERAPLSSSYASQAPSHQRIAADGDPYREPVGP